MRSGRRTWVHVVAACVGGIALGFGLGRLYFGVSAAGVFWSVLGFLVLGWAIFSARRFGRRTPESEIRGGRDIE
ncbi:MAG TPA: hypothetical protein VFL93_17605 [Longimicrobiaceae bacterium]|jgi:hypothetical protein|nr:hypothetical protein [Longimicrobiaceae bacterium]